MKLGALLLECIAHGLDQNPEIFRQKYTKPLGRGQLVYYPPILGRTPLINLTRRHCVVQYRRGNRREICSL